MINVPTTYMLTLTFRGSVGLMDKRMDLIVCRKESRDGFFLGLTSANSSVICIIEYQLLCSGSSSVPVTLVDLTETASQLLLDFAVPQTLVACKGLSLMLMHLSS